MQAAMRGAVVGGDVDRVRRLASKKADFIAADQMGCTLLHRAAVTQNRSMIKMLLELGKTPCEVQDQDGHTPLHDVCDWGDATSARLLLQHGASVRTTDKEGWTPLHFCAYRGHVKAAGVLLAYGADLDARDKNGQRPMDLSMHESHFAMTQYLRDMGASASSGRATLPMKGCASAPASGRSSPCSTRSAPRYHQAGAGSTSAEPQVPLAGVATAMPRPRTVRRALRSCHQDPVGGSASIHPGFSESNMREHGARTADHGMMPPGTWAKPSMTRSALGGAAMTADLPRGAAGRQPAGTHKRQGNMADITNSASAYTEGSPCKKLRTVHEAEAFPAGTEACGGVDVGDDGRRRKSCHSRLSSLPEDFAPMVISSPPAVVAPRRQSLSHLTARPAERAGVPGQATGGLQPRAAPFAMDHFGVGPGGLGCIGSQGTDNLMPTFFSPGKNHPREPASKRDASSGHLHRRTRQQGHAMAAGGASLGGVGATRRASMGSGRPSLSGSLPRSSQGGSKRRMEHWDAGELCSWVDALDMGIDSHRLVQRGVTGRALKNASAAELAFILGINMHQALRVAHEVAACRVSGGQAVAWR